MAYSSELPGVILLSLAASLSLLSVLFFFMNPSLRLHNYGKTHISGYFRSLLVANALQAFGTVLSLKWATEGEVLDGAFCTAQGAIKQAGNISTALWSFVLALHLFMLLFLRIQSTKTGFWVTIVGGWALIVFIIVIGPTVIQTPTRGPYFGVSGAWCWITSNYSQEQILLEYLLEYLSAGFGIILYTFVLLRMRGNLVREEGKWSLRFLPPGESWQLSLRRDLIDYSMVHAVEQMIWYPVVYTLILIPISISRLSSFAGANVPFWATILTDMIFNLTGFANVLLLAATRKLLPDTNELPTFATARKDMRKSLFNAGGIRPFTLERSDSAEQFNVERLARIESSHSSRRSSLESMEKK
ncbi:hypothetical protein C8F04DRAFT_1101405 [Mycena alexandri]|uniref:Glucose receptor Git3 N-terminal domain-containing protein n=1 Tax=Mycena alexandri TaxID=1745969 RepID=A0AAD6SZG3_9AGAR|nr:hypothetical protein C8F04DRAFT_1101405 [Mycena alexandri]